VSSTVTGIDSAASHDDEASPESKEQEKEAAGMQTVGQGIEGMSAGLKWLVSRLRSSGEGAALKLVGEKDEELRTMRRRLQSMRSGLEGAMAVADEDGENGRSGSMDEGVEHGDAADPDIAGLHGLRSIRALLADDDASAAEAKTLREHLQGLQGESPITDGNDDCMI